MTKAERHERTEVDVVLTMTEDEALRIHGMLGGLFTTSGVGGVYDAIGKALGLAPRGLPSGLAPWGLPPPYELVDWNDAPIPALIICKKENA